MDFEQYKRDLKTILNTDGQSEEIFKFVNSLKISRCRLNKVSEYTDEFSSFKKLCSYKSNITFSFGVFEIDIDTTNISQDCGEQNKWYVTFHSGIKNVYYNSYYDTNQNMYGKMIALCDFPSDLDKYGFNFDSTNNENFYYRMLTTSINNNIAYYCDTQKKLWSNEIKQTISCYVYFSIIYFFDKIYKCVCDEKTNTKIYAKLFENNFFANDMTKLNLSFFNDKSVISSPDSDDDDEKTVWCGNSDNEDDVQE
jgi:hypothetical protein